MNNKLKVGIVSCDKLRSEKIILSIYRMEQGTIKLRKDRGTLETDTIIYRTYGNQNGLRGVSVDQVIWDYSLPREDAYYILRNSCVPEEFQIIDDRKIL